MALSPKILKRTILKFKSSVVSFAGVEGADQEAEVREDQREEDGHTHRGAVQGLPHGIHHLLPVLPQPAL